MAYFLDPELAALTTGRPVPGTRMVVTTTPVADTSNRRKNKFGKKCHGCSVWVPAQEGYLGKESGTWVVYCTKCP